jgi:hypothetical protein
MTLAGMTSVIALLFHSLSDFNMHIPANAITLVAVSALTVNAARVPPPGDVFDRGSELL